jgi:hypothetical protein
LVLLGYSCELGGKLFAFCLEVLEVVGVCGDLLFLGLRLDIGICDVLVYFVVVVLMQF